MSEGSDARLLTGEPPYDCPYEDCDCGMTFLSESAVYGHRGGTVYADMHPLEVDDA